MRPKLFCKTLLALALLAATHLSARAGSLEIVGSPVFSNQVQRALLLLRARDPNAYAIVTNYVGRIKQGERSGMWAAQSPPTYEMSTNTALYSITWCAATIAHDSFHSKLYHEYQRAHSGGVPESEWTGRAAEVKCMQHQLAVMKTIGASKTEIDHATQLQDGRYVKDHETWQDYEQRKW